MEIIEEDNPNRTYKINESKNFQKFNHFLIYLFIICINNVILIIIYFYL